MTTSGKTTATMKIKRTQGRRVGESGAGFVMFGNVISSAGGKWFERHFPSAETAQRFAEKRGWAWVTA